MKKLLDAFRLLSWIILLIFFWQGGRSQSNPPQPVVITTPTPDCRVDTQGCGSSQTDSAPLQTNPSQMQAVQLAARQSYIVQAGDTVLDVALELGVDLHEIGCLLRPDFEFSQPLVIGEIVTVLPPEEHCHQVQEGESIDSIAATYGIWPAAILIETWNALSPEQSLTEPLPVGHYIRVWVPECVDGNESCQRAAASSKNQKLLPTFTNFLPWMLAQPINSSPYRGARSAEVGQARTIAPVPKDWPYGSGYFVWPVYGWLTQGYRSDHRAVDIAAPWGTPITAADRGVVIRAGWNNQGYGRMVIIDHKIDYLTLYAHMSQILVKEGEVVAQGQVIGLVGSSGNSTGAHLHFEIRDFGRLVNPLELLGR